MLGEDGVQSQGRVRETEDKPKQSAYKGIKYQEYSEGCGINALKLSLSDINEKSGSSIGFHPENTNSQLFQGVLDGSS